MAGHTAPVKGLCLVEVKYKINIEKDTYSDELLRGFDKMLESGCNLFNMNYLKDSNRELILMLLDKVQVTGNTFPY
ncbi:MAG: hypothetical protein U0586_10555 [Candidatus Brocadiaceae bacterium]